MQPPARCADGLFITSTPLFFSFFFLLSRNENSRRVYRLRRPLAMIYVRCADRPMQPTTLDACIDLHSANAVFTINNRTATTTVMDSCRLCRSPTNLNDISLINCPHCHRHSFAEAAPVSVTGLTSYLGLDTKKIRQRCNVFCDDQRKGSFDCSSVLLSIWDDRRRVISFQSLPDLLPQLYVAKQVH